ncbi:MAG: hypothetical protein P8184_08265 [Calditrichia bacterium]
MQLRTTEDIIKSFLSEIRIFWQVIFLFSVVIYGGSFYQYLSAKPLPRQLPYFRAFDLISFVLAISLALAIFAYKRKYFSLRPLRKFLEKIRAKHPELNENDLARKVTRDLRGRMKTVWLMGGGLILLGVIFYWLTFTTKNMHVYFIVGLYSLMMNYPRKDLFLDIPYLISEMSVKTEENG